MPALRLIALNGNAGPLVAVLATQTSRRVTVREDEAAASTGLQYVRGDDPNANLLTVGKPGTPPTPQIDLFDNMPFGERAGKLQGIGPQGANFAPTTTLLKLQGDAVGATTVVVTEYD